MNKVIVTKSFIGLCYMQVCAEENATDKDILSICNSENPSGTSGGWQYVIRENDKNYEPKFYPVKCSDFQNRKHFIIVC